MISLASAMILMMVIFIFGGIISAIVINYFVTASYRLHKSMDDILILMLKGQLGDYERIEATKSLMNMIIDLATHSAILQFHVFIDTHEISKVTRANVIKLVDQVAHEVRQAIDFDKVKEIDTCFTAEFYEKYIVDVCAKAVKDLMDNEIKNYKGNEG